MKIIWHNRALNDLNENIQYIAGKSPQNAKKVLHKIIDLVNTLQNFPNAYPAEPIYNKPNIRFIAKWHYKIIYKVDINTVYILRIFNTRQDPKKM